MSTDLIRGVEMIKDGPLWLAVGPEPAPEDKQAMEAMWERQKLVVVAAAIHWHDSLYQDSEFDPPDEADAHEALRWAVDRLKTIFTGGPGDVEDYDAGGWDR